MFSNFLTLSFELRHSQLEPNSIANDMERYKTNSFMKFLVDGKYETIHTLCQKLPQSKFNNQNDVNRFLLNIYHDITKQNLKEIPNIFTEGLHQGGIINIDYFCMQDRGKTTNMGVSMPLQEIKIAFTVDAIFIETIDTYKEIFDSKKNVVKLPSCSPYHFQSETKVKIGIASNEVEVLYSNISCETSAGKKFLDLEYKRTEAIQFYLFTMFCIIFNYFNSNKKKLDSNKPCSSHDFIILKDQRAQLFFLCIHKISAIIFGSNKIAITLKKPTNIDLNKEKKTNLEYVSSLFKKTSSKNLSLNKHEESTSMHYSTSIINII